MTIEKALKMFRSAYPEEQPIAIAFENDIVYIQPKLNRNVIGVCRYAIKNGRVFEIQFYEGPSDQSKWQTLI